MIKQLNNLWILGFIEAEGTISYNKKLKNQYLL